MANQVISYSNKFYPIGNWVNYEDSMELTESAGAIKISFNAKEVNIVTKNNAQLKIFLDGVPLTEKYAGSDISFGNKMDVVQCRNVQYHKQ